MKMDAKQAETIIKETQQYAKTILNSLSAHVAIIDEKGMILETNRAWERFAQSNQISIRPDTLNVNYLEVCDAAQGESAEKSKEVAAGIRKVIKGEVEEFVLDYPCHSPNEKRWFYMRAARAVGSDTLRVVVSHENITALKEAESRLRQREEELRQKTLHLEEANAALRAVLRQRDEDIQEMEQTILQNLKDSVLPNVERLQDIVVRPEANQIVQLISSGLNEIASPFLRRLSNLEAVLTPREIEIASLVKAGKSTKEIADLLYLSITTVSFHRRNLRDKLGLTNSSTNLRSHLLSLEK
ncbi:helix-turn-helix domain-containing protein [Desulfatibacillum aliphaticivorans]|uniref:helix-turn-helix domain-containing protein n=1 Tax=Desulfatibacillum aliphaticivorans TaxID=218208 RepID=UPI00200A5537|nr:helix-turn-helix transcriptional regulator [Desulfatibacillum aliphaticivorans]